ncbi:MAG: hypothetical protein KAQ94_02395 [Arcobacteraceae bacterium]|nr:hypothetical protein [Arcobacteraceae bacterium]
MNKKQYAKTITGYNKLNNDGVFVDINFTSYEKIYYDNKQLKLEYFISSDTQDVALIQRYYKSGEFWFESGVIVEDNKIQYNGLFVEFYKNEKCKSFLSYDKGKKHGKNWYFYKNGKSAVRILFIDDIAVSGRFLKKNGAKYELSQIQLDRLTKRKNKYEK